MDHFEYRDGVLHAENVPLDRIADEVGTPFYCYSTATIERHIGVFMDGLAPLDATVCYSVKANSNLSVLKILAANGAGADVVSGGELTRALRAGMPPGKIVFSGVGKTEPEIRQAIRADILQINVESEPELEAVNRVAGELGKTARAAVRLNPDIDAGSHDKISTGRREDKFGVEWTRAHEVFTAGAALPHVELVGLAMHIGSQLADLQPYRDAFTRLRDVTAMLQAGGFEIRTLDLGGGLGTPYDDTPMPSPAEYGAMVREVIGDLGCRFLFEPGRVIAGNAGVLVSRVVYVKEGATRRFLILDAAMNDLIRPALYDASHTIVPIAESADKEREPADIVGPVCETGDTFGERIPMPDMNPGDLVAFRTAGAYSAVMASTYNSRALVPEILVNGDQFAVVRERIEVDDYLARENIAPWLNG